MKVIVVTALPESGARIVVRGISDGLLPLPSSKNNCCPN